MTNLEPIDQGTPVDPSHLKDRSIKTRKQLNVAEAKNILKAYFKYLGASPTKKLAPFDTNWFKQLHVEMFGDVWMYAGNIRQEDLNIGIQWTNIVTEMYQLEHDLMYWEQHQTFDALERSARLHHRAVFIHPFLVGNGRWARLLANIYLKMNGHPLVKWPEETIGTEKSIARDAYLSAVKKADQGDMSDWLDLHKCFLEKPT
jgi:Fic-DOC domain mobile mystery protein B